ncbi:MAG: ATP-binding protein [Caldilineaceae bacterium]
MASALLPRGLTRQVVVVLLLIALAGIVGVSLAAWQAERQALEEQVSNQLEVFASLKRERLQSWLNERQADTKLLAVNLLNQEHFTEILDPVTDEKQAAEFTGFLRDNLIGLQRSRMGYMEVSMTDKDGLVVIGTNPKRIGKPALPPAKALSRVSTIEGSFFCDIFLHPDTGRPVMAFGHVIRGIDLATHQPTSESIGEIVTIVEMESTIYRFLGPIPDLGKSAETMLVRPTDDGIVFLSRLLYLENAPLRLTAGYESQVSRAARRTEMGDNDAFHSTDYSGQPIIAAYRQIEPVGWGLVVKQSQAEAFAPVYDLARKIVGLTALVLLGTALLAILLARTLTRPISALAQATQAIAGGDLSIALHTTRDDELGALSTSFQRMADALAERRQEAQRLTDMLRRRADELESAYSDLRRSDQLKDAFIRNITHELRTPVATLSGFTELLMDEADDFGPEQQEMLQVIAGQSQQVAKLVNDVVALHSVSTARNERRPLRMFEILRAGVDAYRQPTKYRDISPIHQFELYCPEDEMEVMAHPGQLTRVIDNLLDNAVKFSPEGGTIHVQLRHIQKLDSEGRPVHWQVVSVADQGIGIADGDIPHIWERFFQADNTTTRRFGGTGLGLALVKEFVEAHGGEVWADSVPGEGTTVSFSLPSYSAPEPETTGVEIFSPAPALPD